jgi:hypothetical protein
MSLGVRESNPVSLWKSQSALRALTPVGNVIRRAFEVRDIGSRCRYQGGTGQRSSTGTNGQANHPNCLDLRHSCGRKCPVISIPPSLLSSRPQVRILVGALGCN